MSTSAFAVLLFDIILCVFHKGFIDAFIEVQKKKKIFGSVCLLYFYFILCTRLQTYLGAESEKQN